MNRMYYGMDKANVFPRKSFHFAESVKKRFINITAGLIYRLKKNVQSHCLC